jgi:hypothetical protein
VFVVLFLSRQLIGVFAIAALIGFWTNLYSSRDSALIRFDRKMARIHHYIAYKNIPVPVALRINKYYQYIWENEKGVEEGAVLARLPLSLKNEVVMFRAFNTLSHVELFKDLTEGFLLSVSFLLRPQTVPAGDYVVIAGEIANELYVINKGVMQVIDPKTLQLKRTLTEGTVFGEVALLQVSVCLSLFLSWFSALLRLSSFLIPHSSLLLPHDRAVSAVCIFALPMTPIANSSFCTRRTWT